MMHTTLASDFTILAIETSCDETAAAVVRGGREIIANVVASQIDEHRRYGGIVPEVAARQHILALPTVVREALAQLPGGWDAIHAVAATYGPGLSGALLTGLNAAKAIAWSRGLPFVGVNHLEAHIYANWLIPGQQSAVSGRQSAEPDDRRPTTNDRQPEARTKNKEQRTKESETLTPSPLHPFTPSLPSFPLVALVVSGGHTLLALLEGHGSYRLLGQTRDDAAGEAFDKAARIMGLGFPGGPAIQRAATSAPGGVTLPRAWLRDSYDFSFSGLKTAVLHQVQGRREREEKVATKNLPQRDKKGALQTEEPALHGPSPAAKADGPRTNDKFMTQLAYAFQESVVDVLVTKTVDAARAFDATEILLAGGVAANARLREELARRSPLPLRCPPPALCTDNAAMIAAAAFYRFDVGRQSGWDLDVEPNLPLA
jgi:tRNA N6-adenosine threonylcarbamoyltransferase